MSQEKKNKCCRKKIKVFESNKNEGDKTKNRRSRIKSNLVYNNDFTFYKYRNTKEFAAKRSFNSTQNDLREFKNILEFCCHDIEEIKPNK